VAYPQGHLNGFAQVLLINACLQEKKQATAAHLLINATLMLLPINTCLQTKASSASCEECAALAGKENGNARTSTCSADSAGLHYLCNIELLQLGSHHLLCPYEQPAFTGTSDA